MAGMTGVKLVVSEIYDEIVFVEPSSFLFQRLKDTEGKPVKAGNETDCLPLPLPPSSHREQEEELQSRRSDGGRQRSCPRPGAK